MATEQLILLLIGSLALLSLLLGLWLLLVSNEQRKELRRLRQLLSGDGEEIVEPINSSGRTSAVKPVDSPMFREVRDSFSARLNEVERERRQAPPAAHAPVTPRNPAEKYSYVASLASQGMTVAQIADALQMAPAEVDQLLRLASLKQGS